MAALLCPSCGAPMALAEAICASCGAKAPEGRAATLLMEQAEAAWEAGQQQEASAKLKRALDLGLPAEKRPLASRKLGVWLEKRAEEEKNPSLLSQAGLAFQQAIEGDDNDSIAHQLYIANWGKQGRLHEADRYYQARLAKDPSDAVAAKQLALIKLNADFINAPRPTALDLPPTIAERWLRPRPWKIFSAVTTLGSSLAMMAYGLAHKPAPAGSDPLTAGLGLPDSTMDMLNDPALWGLQAAVSALFLVFMYRHRK